jgi:hypothetical protein
MRSEIDAGPDPPAAQKAVIDLAYASHASDEQDGAPTMVRARKNRDMGWRRVALPASEQMIFEVVRLEVEGMAQLVILEYIAARGGQPCDSDWLASRRLAVFEAGLNEFDRQRRLYSDTQVPRWRKRVRDVMTASAKEVFGDSLDDGLGGSSLDDRDPGGTPSGRRAGPIDDAAAPTRSRLTVPRGRYVATREDLAAYALSSATRQVRRRIRTWTNDSELLEDMVEMAATRSIDKCLANWDADSAPLLRYVDLLIKYAVYDELRTRSRTQAADARVIDACSADLGQSCGLHECNELDADPLACLVRLDDEHEYEGLRRRVHAAIAMLGDVQRAEVHRRLAGGEPGTHNQQQIYSRALKKLRLLVGTESHASRAN